MNFYFRGIYYVLLNSLCTLENCLILYRVQSLTYLYRVYLMEHVIMYILTNFFLIYLRLRDVSIVPVASGFLCIVPRASWFMTDVALLLGAYTLIFVTH